MKTYKTLIQFLLIVILPPLTFTLFNTPYPKVSGMFISVVLLWFTEIIPLALTGLLVPLLAILLGVTDIKGAFGPFGNQILFLFMGSFFLAKAMEKHGWDKRMAYTLLSSHWGAKTLRGILLQVSLICWLLSMWISNTATCAIIVPIILGLMETLKDNLKNEKERANLQTSFLLTAAFASSIGGMATPVGSPPNLMAMTFLKSKGIDLSFIQWMGYGLPVSFAMLIALFLILGWKYPLPKSDLTEIKNHFKEELGRLGRIKREEVQVMIVFGLAVFLWMFPGVFKMIMPESQQEMVKQITSMFPMGLVGVLCASLLFILPTENGDFNLTWKEANSIDWGTIWLFGGGMAMGSILDKSGLASFVGAHLFSGTLPLPLMAILVIITGVLLSEFSSNTASTAIIVPLLLGTLGIWGTEATKALIIAAAFGASFGFMLPVSTPPNAIVYGTGKLKLKEMMRTGCLFDLSGALIIWGFMMAGFYLFSA
jgi:sodium-dependent dicarboxylate transporter 2/3/5